MKNSVWKCVHLFASVVILAGCASRIDTVVSDASDQPYWNAVYVPSEGTRMAQAMADLETRLSKGFVSVERVEKLPPFGLCLPVERRIMIRAELSIDGQFEVLAHEAGHLLQSPAIADNSLSETFAELVGVEIQAYYRSQTGQQTASKYLSVHKHAFIYLPILKPDIERAARIILGFEPWPPKIETVRPSA
jgi:hypothetical protein